jgi:hypothetical protein
MRRSDIYVLSLCVILIMLGGMFLFCGAVHSDPWPEPANPVTYDGNGGYSLPNGLTISTTIAVENFYADAATRDVGMPSPSPGDRCVLLDDGDGRAVSQQYNGSAWVTTSTIYLIKGDKGDPGVDGEDAAEISVRVDSGYIQWQRVGDAGWTNLIATADLQGDPGADATNIELQKTDTHIQWRLVGGTWADLVALADITGPPGSGIGDMLAANNLSDVANAQTARENLGLGADDDVSHRSVTIGSTELDETDAGYLDGFTSDPQTQISGKEDVLGNPGSDGYVLSSTTAGVRSWIANSTVTEWDTDYSYAQNDIVANDGTLYTCDTGHTSGDTTEPGVGALWDSYWSVSMGSDTADRFTESVTVQSFTAADTSPDVSNGGSDLHRCWITDGVVTIIDFDDGDDHSEFTSGDWFSLEIGHAITISNNANIFIAQGNEYTATVGEVLTFQYNGTMWLCRTAVVSGTDLSDPEADSILGWDDSDVGNEIKYFWVGTGLAVVDGSLVFAWDYDFDDLINTPTTLSGYGITDGATNTDLTNTNAAWTGKPDMFVASFNPQDVYDNDSTNHQIELCPRVPAAFTVSRLYVVCDSDPTTELTVTFSHKAAGVGYGSPTTIEAVTTTAGEADITSGIDDATVDATNKIFFTLSDPDDALTLVTVMIEGNY